MPIVAERPTNRSNDRAVSSEQTQLDSASLTSDFRRDFRPDRSDSRPENPTTLQTQANKEISLYTPSSNPSLVQTRPTEVNLLNNTETRPQPTPQQIELSKKQAEEVLLQNIRRQAAEQAQLDFNRDPAGAPDMQRIQTRLQNTIEKSGLKIDATLQERIATEFKTQYSNHHEHLYNSELNWVQRRYYDIKSVFNSTWQNLTSAVSSVAKVVNRGIEAAVAVKEAITELAVETAVAAAPVVQALAKKVTEVRDTIVGGITSVVEHGASAVASSIYSTFRTLTSPSTYVNLAKQVGSVTVGALSMIRDGAFAVSDGIQDALVYTAKTGLNVLRTLSNPVELAKAIVSTAKSIYQTGKNIVDIGKNIIQGGIELIGNAASAIGSALKSSWNFITSPETWTAIGNGIVNVGKAIGNAFTATYNFITSKETWNAVGSFLKAAVDPATYKNAITAISNVASNVWNFVTDPKNIEIVKQALISGVHAVGRLAVDIINNPEKALTLLYNAGAATVGFLKNVSDSIGLTDLVVGIGKMAYAPIALVKGAVQTAMQLGSDVVKVLKGEITAQELKENLKNNIKGTVSETLGCISAGAQAIKGAVLLFGEVSGITDCIMTVKYALEGNWAMAAMHAGFALASIGAITATVATAGVAAGSIAGVAMLRVGVKQAVKQVVSTAAKNFLKNGAEQIGKEVVQTISQKLTPEIMQATAKEIANKGSHALAEQVLKQGSQALTHETVQQAMRESARESTELMLRQAGLVEAVDVSVTNLLKNIQDKSVRAITRELKDQGIENPKQLAKELKRLIKTGKGDEEIKNILEAGITKQVTQHLEKNMESTFKEQFAKILRGQLDEAASPALRETSQILNKAAREQAEKLGKNIDEFTDELVEAGWKGAKEGIEEATQKLVREGIERAFKRFREHGHLRPNLGSGDASFEQGREQAVNNVENIVEAELVQRPDIDLASAEIHAHRSETRVRPAQIDGVSGQCVERLVDGTWEMESFVPDTNSTQVSLAKKNSDQDSHNIFSLSA